MDERETTEEERVKLLVEAEKIRVDTAFDRKLEPVKLRKAEAEARKMEFEVMKAEADFAHKQLENLNLAAGNEILALNKRMAQLQVSQIEHNERVRTAGDLYHHVHYVAEPVDTKSIDRCMERLIYWNRTDPGCNIEIVFTSPGGSVVDALVLYDFIQQLKREGHYVTTHTLGMAASIASVLLQAGSKRTMAKEAWMLIHELQAGGSGKSSEMEDELRFYKRIQARFVNLYMEGVERAKSSGTATTPLTKKALLAAWNHKDFWLSSDECLAAGLV